MPIYYNNQRDLGNPMAQAGIAPPLYQRSPYATATVMAHPVMQVGDRGYYPPTGGAYPQYPYGAPYGPSVGFGVGTAPTWSVTPLTGYPSAYPHVLNGAVMAGEPFRMTQYFGPAYMPGYMDMLFTQMMQGMMRPPRRSGGSGGGGGATKEAPSAPSPAMDIKWAPCTTKGCQGRSLLFDSGVDTGMPLVDTPADLAADAAEAAGATAGDSTPAWPIAPGATMGGATSAATTRPFTARDLGITPGVPGEGLLDFAGRHLRNYFGGPAPTAPIPNAAPMLPGEGGGYVAPTPTTPRDLGITPGVPGESIPGFVGRQLRNYLGTQQSGEGLLDFAGRHLRNYLGTQQPMPTAPYQPPTVVITPPPSSKQIYIEPEAPFTPSHR